MKRALVLSLAVVIGMGIMALAGPYFGVEYTGPVATAVPEFICGADFSADIGGAWDVTVDGWYTDPDLLDLSSTWMLDLAVSVKWGHTVVVNQSGSLSYGCEFTIGQSIDLIPANYPTTLGVAEWSTNLLLEGYVGPLCVWVGGSFPYNGGLLAFEPSIGFFVHW